MADLTRKTANLFNLSAYSSAVLTNCTITVNNDVLAQTNTGTYARSAWKIDDLQVGTDYILSVNFTNPNASELQLRIYDSSNNSSIIGSSVSRATTGNLSVTFTAATSTHYIRIYSNTSSTANTSTIDFTDIMLNDGSTAKPYEPYGWVHSLRKLTTATDTLTTLPAVLYTDGQSATVGLMGNMSQTGTPTPQNPIQPSECGERTGNLFDKYGEKISPSNTTYNYTLTGLTPNAPYTCSTNFVGDKTKAASLYFAGGNTGTNGVWSDTPKTFNANADGEITVYVRRITVADSNPAIYDDLMTGAIWIMVNEGSTPLPYEPFGVKIPISSANTTTPVYLGEVESTRQIKKLVLTGDENWSKSAAQTGRYNLYLSGYFKSKGNITSVCTHYLAVAQQSGGQYPDNTQSFYAGSDATVVLYIHDSSLETLADFKTYLAQQYAAGTPVCVWYVLAEPTTAVVNEPLCKIGEYADTVSGISIPTITGADSFDVLTTLKPSEVSLTYTGWHDASVKEKSENLLDFNKLQTAPSGVIPDTTFTFDHLLVIEAAPNTTYIMSATGTGSEYGDANANRSLYFCNVDNRYSVFSGHDVTYTTSSDGKLYVGFISSRDNAQQYINGTAVAVINEGSTPLPYEPYWE